MVFEKLKEYEPVEPDEGLAERIQGRIEGGQLSSIAVRLGVTKRILALFPQQPPEDYLHILVQHPVGAFCSLTSEPC